MPEFNPDPKIRLTRGRAIHPDSGRPASSELWSRIALGVFAALLLASPLPAWAGQFVLGLDLDQSGETDCSATLSDQPGSQEFTGLDRWIEVVVNPTPPARVTSFTILGCDGHAFTESLYATTSEWPVAVGAGVDGTDVLEWQVPSTVLDGAQSARLVVGSLQDGGNADAMLSAGPIVIGTPASVPLLSLVASLVLALGLGIVAIVFLRRLPRSSVAWLLVGFIALADHRAAALIGLLIDGDLSDWAGIPASASDPAGDSADPYGRGDIRSLTAAFDGGDLFVRLDAESIEDAPCQTTPVVANSADLSTCSGTPSGSSCSLECAPGWEPSPASLSCEYGAWDPTASCWPIVLEVNSSTSLEEDLAVASLNVASGITLSLADGVALSTGELTMAPGSVLGSASANVSVSVGGTATLLGDAQIVADQLTLSGGDWSLQDTAVITANLEADVTSLSVCPDCAITASAQGYPASAGPGGAATSGSNRSGSGAGHGGTGSVGYYSSSGGGSAYGDPFAPDTPGSGGGAGCAGAGAAGAGGGALRIQVSGTLSLLGALMANGANGANCSTHGYYGGGGGAGGSIWLTVGTLQAPAGNRIEAKGGHAGGIHSTYRGGGGGGGRVRVETGAVISEPDATLWSVDAGTGRVNGTEGTLWLNHDDEWTAHAANRLDSPTNWNSLSLSPGSELLLEAGVSLTLTELVIHSGASILPGDSASLSTDTLVMLAGAIIEGDLFKLSITDTATLLGNAQITAENLTLSGGDWLLEDTASITANLKAEVTSLSVCPDCAITASAQGYTASAGPGGAATSGINRSGSGAGHGGTGSTGYNSLSEGGSAYGDPFAPDTPGSGGGAGCAGAGVGGAGGGALRIQVSGTLSLLGALIANGANGANCSTHAFYGGGGGAGGSIWLTAGTLEAPAGNRIEAKGGHAGGTHSTYRGGGGGGGRVRVETGAVISEPDATLWSVDAGTGRVNGTEGTLWLNHDDDWTAHAANRLDSLTNWNSLSLSPGSELLLEAGVSLTLTELVIHSGASILPGDSASLSTDTLVMLAGAIVEGDLFELSITDTATLLGNAQITAENLTLSGGEWLLEDTASITANLKAEVTSLSVCPDCAITASAQGYPASAGPGGAATSGINRSGSGAGHGGTGGTGYNSLSGGGSAYGDALVPDTPGSGGGAGCAGAGAAGAGGGALRIQVSGTLSLLGALMANGANGANCSTHAFYGGGGGAGGSIWLTVGTLQAPAGNRIEAKGGHAGGTHSTYRGGGGGGGRVRVEAGAVISEPDTAFWSVGGGTGRMAGDQGSARLEAGGTITILAL